MLFPPCINSWKSKHKATQISLSKYASTQTFLLYTAAAASKQASTITCSITYSHSTDTRKQASKNFQHMSLHIFPFSTHTSKETRKSYHILHTSSFYTSIQANQHEVLAHVIFHTSSIYSHGDAKQQAHPGTHISVHSRSLVTEPNKQQASVHWPYLPYIPSPSGSLQHSPLLQERPWVQQVPFRSKSSSPCCDLHSLLRAASRPLVGRFSPSQLLKMSFC